MFGVRKMYLDLLDLTKSKLEWKHFEFPDLKARILRPNREIWKTGSANGWFKKEMTTNYIFKAAEDTACGRPFINNQMTVCLAM